MYHAVSAMRQAAQTNRTSIHKLCATAKWPFDNVSWGPGGRQFLPSSSRILGALDAIDVTFEPNHTLGSKAVTDSIAQHQRNLGLKALRYAMSHPPVAPAMTKPRRRSSVLRLLQTSLTADDFIAVELSLMAYRFFWLSVLLLRLACALFLLASGRLYWFLAHPYMAYYAALLGPDLTFKFRTFGSLFACVGIAHMYQAALMIGSSIRYRHLVFGPRQHHNTVIQRGHSMMSVLAITFNLETYNFEIEPLYDDVWFSNMVLENHQVLALSPLDFVFKLVPHISIYSCIGSIKALVRNHLRHVSAHHTTTTSRHDDTSGDQTTSQTTATPHMTVHKTIGKHQLKVKRASKHSSMMAHGLFIVWGAVILALHLRANAPKGFDAPFCEQEIHPWFASKYACSVFTFNCYRNGSTTVSEEALEHLEDDSLVALVFSHCPALTVPRKVRDFHNLLGLDMYNSTIVSWPTEAAITNETHPALLYIIFVRVNMTRLPDGVLQTLPDTMTDFEMSMTNLTTLPDDLDKRWHAMAILYVEHSPVSVFPPVLLRLPVDDLSFIGDELAVLPDLSQSEVKFTTLSLAHNPLTALPDDIGDTSGIGFLELSNTMLAELPPWMDSVRTTASNIFAFNTPFCNSKSESDVEAEFGASAVLTCRDTDSRANGRYPLTIMLPKRKLAQHLARAARIRVERTGGSIPLQPHTFSCVWLVLLLAHIGCVLFLVGTAALCWFITSPNLTYYSNLLRPDGNPLFQVSSVMCALMAVAHAHHAFVMVRASLAMGELCFTKHDFGPRNPRVEELRSVRLASGSSDQRRQWRRRIHSIRMALIVIPTILFMPYWRAFDKTQYAFDISLFYNDVWFTNMVMENQQIFPLSIMGFLLKYIPHISIYLCLGSIKALLSRGVAANSQSRRVSPLLRSRGIGIVSDRVIEVASDHLRVQQLRQFRPNHRLEILVHILFILWGVAILAFHLHAARQSLTSNHNGCEQPMRPWFATKYACSVMQFNCYRNGSTGVSEDALDYLDEASLAALIITHCPALTMPTSLRQFPNLLGVELHNCTLVRWGPEAAVSAEIHTKMQYTVLARVNMTELPLGLRQPLPDTLTDIEVSVTNLTALPADLNTTWHDMSIFYLEWTQIPSFPTVLSTMKINDMSVIGNRFRDVDILAHAPCPYYTFSLSHMPLAALPDQLYHADKGFDMLSFEFTNLDSVPAWIDSRVHAGVYMHGTPYCHQNRTECTPCICNRRDPRGDGRYPLELTRLRRQP
ncbi:TPA: LOW QUALITY PROTEIN: hypothetical protein N0F65_008221 [Lagenidium giganteum]|uniref:Leucine-rich repeat domain, L domain-like n=1 Tax=Lagenidium giganteum TaxID=4803 RepID=A0AAV2Z1C3_9STRA|nr:TPA: LOW QUALITY PROTEIN: hypothetical protein N0F65_008221 [Lagenidium giganteum]